MKYADWKTCDLMKKQLHATGPTEQQALHLLEVGDTISLRNIIDFFCIQTMDVHRNFYHKGTTFHSEVDSDKPTAGQEIRSLKLL